ncbi:MAG TPA: GntR family transcriptional regulator [Candidatus Limnocylindria bacterium]|jgi:DNA-binding GntR family transcriptional regulator|nr:GntR family transcriptional regulator [Candidatus Limnocylindria bacterium]
MPSPRSEPSGTTAVAESPTRDVDAVVALLRSDIATGAFQPNEHLVEAAIAARYDTKRPVVRAALLVLAKEGLIEHERNRGARVRAITLREAIEISEVRMVVEGLCAAKAAELADDEEIAALRELTREMAACVANGEVPRYSTLNARLHERIAEFAKQRTAGEILTRLARLNVRHQFSVALLPRRMAISLPQHEAIVEAIAAHDPARAESAMREHLASVIEALREVSELRGIGV